MRTTVFLIICNLLTLHATVFSQSNVTMRGENMPLKNALVQIEKEAQVKFVYRDETISDFKVSFNLKNSTIEETLNTLLKGTGSTFRALGNNLIVISPIELLQGITISGLITDASGEPLPGVNVLIKGTTTGVVTDVDGKYAIPVPNAGTVLQFSFMGYATQEITVNDQRVIDIKLAEDVRQLDEVVVVGYGVQKKITLTGAISSTTAEDISRSSATTTSGAIVGKIAGVNSRMSDGRPGASTSINIRNFGTPLYIIDGVQKDEGQFNNIDFNDIESISVMKDASASIYGVRAANGVVVVTTKKGKRGETNNINVNSYYGWQHLFKYPRPADVSTYISSYIQSDAIKGTSNPKYTMDDLAKWEKGTEKGYVPFDWYDYILHTSPQWYVGVNASGGSEKINYYVALSHIDQQNTIRNYGGFYRTNVQMNVDANITKKLKFGGGMNGRIEKRRQPGVPGGDDIWQGLFATYRNLPTARPYANDNPKYPAQTSPNTETNFAMLNYDLSGEYQETWRVIQLNFNAEYEIFDGLKAKGLFSYYLANKWMDNQEFTYKLYGYDEATDTYPVVFSMDNPYRERDIRKNEELTGQFQLTYDKQFGKHTVGAVFAAEAMTREEPGFWVHDRPASNSLSLMYFQTMDTYNDDGKRTQARLGYAGRINYNYDQRYLFEFSARYDGSWKFPPGHRWGFFPSASAGWRISAEDFWQKSSVNNVFTDLKIRASYGLVGDDNMTIDGTTYYSAFDYMPGYTYKDGGSPLDGNYVVGTKPRGLPVTTLSWLKAKIFDAGIDFAFFGGKLSGSLDYFRRMRDGLPASRYDVLVPAETGFDLPRENLNSDVHTGIDGSLTWRDKIADVRYYAGGNFTFSRKLDWHQYKPRYGNAWDEYRNTIYERYAYLNWGYHSIGQFQSWDEIAQYKIDNDGQGNKTIRPGDIKYEDVNGDGVINSLDERPIGYREGGLPYFNFALNLGAEYKGFDLSVDFTGAAFATYTLNWESRNPFHDGGNNPQYYMSNQWRLSNITDANSDLIPGKYPTLIEGNGSHSNYWKSDFWTKNVNYLKLRNLEFGYTLPKNWLSKVGIEKFRIYTLMQNLFCIDNLGDIDIDPEITGGSGVQYPTNRVINIGVSLTF